ncbi:MAG: hypothetical protein IKJ83_00485, partial [Ruminococcus sp.]|nr:hypothetical protein [Ruminococcus sp.]
MKKPKLIKEKYKNRFSLTILFALVVFFVLTLSIAIFVAATFTMSKFGMLEADKVNNPDIKTLII